MDLTFYLFHPDQDGICQIAQIVPMRTSGLPPKNYLYLHIKNIPRNGKFGTDADALKQWKKAKKTKTLDTSVTPTKSNQADYVVLKSRFVFDTNLLNQPRRDALIKGDRTLDLNMNQVWDALRYITVDENDIKNQSKWGKRAVTLADFDG